MERKIPYYAHLCKQVLAGITTVGPMVAAGGIAAAPPAAVLINSAVIASPVTTVALTYAPQINQAGIKATDFLSGYLPGTPPPTRAGYAGWIYGYFAP